MSWGVTFPPMTQAEFLGGGLSSVGLPPQLATPEHLAQLEVCKSQAIAMFLAGGLGPIDQVDYISGTFGGHSNDSYGYRAGWSNTSVFVNLYHADVPPPPQPNLPPKLPPQASGHPPTPTPPVPDQSGKP